MPFTGGPTSDVANVWLWRIFYPPIRAIGRALFPLRVEGLEHLPPRGPYIAVANHTSWYDPPALTFGLDVPVRYMTKREIFELPILGWVVRGIGSIPVRRGEGDRRAVETALAVLQARQPLGSFPEGTRSRTGRLRRVKPGVAFIARRSGAPVVPVGIIGAPQGGPELPPRRRILLRVGRPFTVAEIEGAAAMDDQALADAIMRRVAELLPDEMRGEYAPVH